jgi:hypothetical protein
VTPEDRRQGIRLILWGGVGLIAAAAFIVVALVLVGWRELGTRLGL